MRLPFLLATLLAATPACAVVVAPGPTRAEAGVGSGFLKSATELHAGFAAQERPDASRGRPAYRLSLSVYDANGGYLPPDEARIAAVKAADLPLPRAFPSAGPWD
ncbi:hypothetical protein [Pseudogemmobacter humi]|uniref:Uncharacterized protein n=1 Tax=Pseudogemmobacter humi TaxID=2483812 RepID=A0A3P5XBA7_9RHOB|nr:hypothetical protein [Pseudogemmobacter humi]VDC28582.1 hypothetical protein XINFAN_02160 [Pseudogemmobacter humi]